MGVCVGAGGWGGWSPVSQGYWKDQITQCSSWQVFVGSNFCQLLGFFMDKMMLGMTCREFSVYLKEIIYAFLSLAKVHCVWALLCETSMKSLNELLLFSSFFLALACMRWLSVLFLFEAGREIWDGGMRKDSRSAGDDGAGKAVCHDLQAKIPCPLRVTFTFTLSRMERTAGEKKALLFCQNTAPWSLARPAFLNLCGDLCAASKPLSLSDPHLRTQSQLDLWTDQLLRAECDLQPVDDDETKNKQENTPDLKRWSSWWYRLQTLAGWSLRTS